MDRRSLLTAGIAGAAGIAVGNELGAAPAGAAADVDRAEFEALKARVDYLETFHPPMPTTTTTTTTTVPPHVPKFSGNVSLPDGFVVPFGEVWDFDPTVSTTVTVSKNVVVAGTLQMRPANPGIVHTLRFTNVDETLFVGGGMDPLDTDVGLWVVGAGKLDIAGAAKTAWARTAAPVSVGAQSVTLAAAPSGWQVGDTVMIAPSNPPTMSYAYDHYDTATITSISGATIGLSMPCGYAHPHVTVAPGFTLAPEVMNLTRNTRIEGTASGRSHVFIRSSSPQSIGFLGLAFMGPRKAAGALTASVTGRYPLHFHMCADGARGSVVSGSVVNQSGGRAFVPHLSNGVTFDGCVAHDVFESPFWWDLNTTTVPSMSNDITFSKCIASRVKYHPNYNGYRLAGFMLGQGDNCVVRDCAAVGIQGDRFAAGFIWPEGADRPWTFERNITHNNLWGGLFTWQNGPLTHVVKDFVAYHNGHTGISHGAYLTGYQYQNGFVYGNRYVSLNLDAHSYPAPSEQRFDRIAFDGAGMHATAITLATHTLAAGRPTTVAGCTFAGYSGPLVAVPADYPSNKPEALDLVESGPVVPSFNATSKPESVIRVQNAGVAKQYTPSGVIDIVPFATYAGGAPTAFSVLSAA